MPIDGFMNTYDEIHSVWYGITDAWRLFRDPGEADYAECKAEPHYYRMGYILGKGLEAGFFFFLGGLVTKVMIL